mmetsp:Transcript_22643/g.34833  ORF Transcript_22643/g.34833 Transcript_22643/m.34833 type:complete len:240 (+) Transcript_22643:144-863(+)
MVSVSLSLVMRTVYVKQCLRMVGSLCAALYSLLTSTQSPLVLILELSETIVSALISPRAMSMSPGIRLSSVFFGALALEAVVSIASSLLELLLGKGLPSRLALASAAAFLAAASARSNGVISSSTVPYPEALASSMYFFNFSCSFFRRSSSLAYRKRMERSFFFSISALSYGSPQISSFFFSDSSRFFMDSCQMRRFFLARSRLISISRRAGLGPRSITSSKVAYGFFDVLMSPGGPPT